MVERARLVSIVNMLASDSDGERANAAGMIMRFALAEKKLVADFLRDGLGASSSSSSSSSGKAHNAGYQKTWQDYDDEDEIGLSSADEAAIRACQAEPRYLDDWETNFLESLLERGRALSTKQRDIVADLPRRIRIRKKNPKW